MAILEKIEADFQQAFKEQKKDVMSTLRLLLASLKNEKIKKMADLTDEDTIKIIKSEIKKRQEAIIEYQKGNREDLAAKEKQELSILNQYLPEQMSPEAVKTEVIRILSQLEDKDNIGRVMGAVMAELKGQADGSLVKKIVEEELTK